MTLEQLKQIASSAAHDRVELFFPYISKYMKMFEIIGRLREAAFIAQILWESGNLRYTKEIASGIAYEGRKDLGNNDKGDGVKYKGRGLIQITGEANYKGLSIAFGEDFISFPELLELPKDATKSAAWWFLNHGLNKLADESNFRLITKRINGGYNGLAGRTLLYEKALSILE